MSRTGISGVHDSPFSLIFRCITRIYLFRPILRQGLRKCILPGGKFSVTLFLPDWADNVHVSQRNDCQMDPWLNLISEGLLLELISARTTEAVKDCAT